MTIQNLLDKWQQELHYYTAAHNVTDVMEIDNVADRCKASAIRDFIEDIKKLPNEPKVVRNNEQVKKDCTHYFIPGRVTVGTEVCIHCGFARMKQSD